MDNKYDETFLIIQAAIDANKQETDEKQIKTDEKLTQIKENLKVLIAFMMDKSKNTKFSPAQKDTSTLLYSNTGFLDNRIDPPL